MICVWLVEAGVFSSATESLDYFGNRRTDKNVSTKFQGVSISKAVADKCIHSRRNVANLSLN